MSRTFTVTIDAPAKWLNSNDRYKRRPDQLTAVWRDAATVMARAGKLPKLDACHITAVLSFPDRIRRDCPNYYPTIKATIDGLVRAGVLDDDDDLHVRSLTIQRGEQVGRRKLGAQGRLVLHIREVAS